MRPSGENSGAASQAGLAAVMSRGGAEPSSLTWNRSKLVLQGSVRPAIRAEKTSVAPSGAMA